MALSFLSGNETPTAARLNELWAEAESIIDKALDGKSTYLVQSNGIIAPTESIHFGKEFFFYTPGNHDADDLSVLHAVRQPLPASYDQTTYDNKASTAILGYVDSVNKWVLSDDALGLDFSLKAHTQIVGGEKLYLWDRGQPTPEKHWRFAVAEILIGDPSLEALGKQYFEFSSQFDKYNCFKLHNLTQNEITFCFGEDGNYHFCLTIPAFSQRCVRRDSVSSGYDDTHKYFFKTVAGDPRFLHFNSHAGFVPQSMRANNITNASFLYNILEAIGQRADAEIPLSMAINRITFDAHTYNDVGVEYASGGYVPTITDDTLVGDLIFHRGALSYFRATTTAAIPEFGSVSFNGFGSITDTLAAGGLTGSDAADGYTINTAAGFDVFYLWQKSSNLLVGNDSPRVLNLGSSGGSSAALETDIGAPTVATFGGGEPHPTNGVGTSISDTINAATVTVGDYVDLYKNALSNHATTSGESISLTTEGAILFSKEFWPICTNETPTGPTGVFDGLSVNNYFDLELNDAGDACVTINTDRALAYRLDGTESRSGWPSNRLKFHRMFEGPKYSRVYENRGDAYVHLDFNNDPAGPDGADFTLNQIGALTDSGVAFQTCDITTKIEPWGIDIVNTPSYPLTLVNDVSKELEDESKTTTTISGFQAAAAGDSQIYCRMNLLKEHYNDLVNALKRCKKIRPLCFDEIFFGNLTPIPTAMSTKLFTLYMSPRNCYAAFYEDSDQHKLYLRLGVPIRTKSSFPDDIGAHAVMHDQNVINAYRWVSINDVKARAAELGFKFRYEKQFALLKYSVETLEYSNATFDVGTFDTTSSGNAGDWKIPVATPVLSGSAYINTLTSYYIRINAYNYEAGTRLKSTTTDANRAILFYSIDTSRTETGPRFKLAEKQIAASSGPVGADTVTELESQELVVTPSETTGQYVYCFQVTPPVTHSA